MYIRQIHSSSNKIVGTIDFFEDRLVIKNKNKPELVIDDSFIINNFLITEYKDAVIKILYDNYTLSVGEIACIFGESYSRMYNYVCNNRYKFTTSSSSGRRNASYGKEFSLERKQKISKAHIGLIYCNNGKKEILIRDKNSLPDGYSFGRLPFSEETKNKIRQAGLDGKYLSPSERSKRGWQRGKFSNVNFKKGIAGYFTSNKMNQKIFFRSLLELYYLINYLELSKDVESFKYEPFIIKCDNKTNYTPDFLVNDKYVIELKSYRFIYKQGGKVQKKFEYKKEQAEKYCINHKLIYRVVFDEEINFSYETLSKQLYDDNLITRYNIEFLQSDRAISRFKKK